MPGFGSNTRNTGAKTSFVLHRKATSMEDHAQGILGLHQHDGVGTDVRTSGHTLFQQVRSDSYRHLLLTGMSRFLLSKPKQQDLLTV